MSTTLTARSTPEPDPGPPPSGSIISAFCSARRSLWGLGVALRIDVPAPWNQNLSVVAEALAQIECSDDVDAPASGPVAFAALPFDTNEPGQFIVPVELHGANSEGQRWVTVIEDSDTPGEAVSTPVLEPREISVSSAVDPVAWCSTVEEARARILRGDMTKVVLSRQILVDTDQPIDAATLFNRLRGLYPDSMSYAVDGFLGASPELLVSRIGEVVRAHPMAGTTPRSGDPAIDQQAAAALIASDKNRVEHQITIDMVHESLLPWCSYLDAEPTPSVVAAGPVQHLATLVEGRLSQPVPSVLDLVSALHPTPAVGGWPVAPALDLIAELEPIGRGRYAGPVGWVDSRGNGAFAVGVRSAQLTDNQASLFAGVGIVADSDPVLELEETRTKARALLQAIVMV
ncbi:MAG: isochorismate synthase [Microthrixaceae bacterium]|nr:isochorismate synthase [Microthrixaceae bacterium]